MQWLAERFGWSALDSVEVVVPNAHSLRTGAGTTDEQLRRVFDRVCTWMGVDHASIEFVPFDADDAPEVQGLYEAENLESGRPTIYVCRELLEDVEVLVAVCAHELSHHRLLGEGLQSGDEPDMEHVTDLLPVLLGMGVFAANAVLREYSETIGQWFHWGANKSGYLPTRLLGYALALLVHERGERRPEWRIALRPDARSALRSGLRYLGKAQHPQFGPNAMRITSDDLDDPCPARRVAAMWELADDPLGTTREIERVAENLRHPERDVRLVAARLLARVPEAIDPVLDDLLGALDDPVVETRRAVLATIRQRPIDPGRVVPELLACLDRHPWSSLETARALAAYGVDAARGFDRLVKVLARLLPTADECSTAADHVALVVDACGRVNPSEYEEWLRFSVKDAHDDVRNTLEQAIREISDGNRPAEPPLEPLEAVPWTSTGWVHGSGTVETS